MNPSYFGDLNSGFSGSSPICPNLTSNPPSVSRASGRGLSRPRFVKVRKQSGSHNSKPAGEIREEPGFNPFRPILGGAQLGVSRIGKNDAFVFGATSSDLGDKGIYEGIKNLRIGSANEVLDSNLNGSDRSGFVFGRDRNRSSNLDVKLENLTTNDNENVVDGRSKISAHDKAKFGLGNGGNVDVTSIGKNLELDLSDELKKKLNVATTGNIDNRTGGIGTFSASDRKKFGLESNGKGGETSAESSENPLPDRIKNLSIKDHVMTNATSRRTSEKDGDTCRGRETARGYIGGERETIMSNEMGCKLNLENTAGKSSDHPDGSFSTSRLFDKDMQAGKKSVKMSPVFVDAIPTEFIFRGGLQGKNTIGSEVPMGQPKVDTQTDLSCGGLAGGDGFGLPSTGRPERTCKQDNVQSPFIEFKTPKQWGSLFSSQKPELGSKLQDSKVRKKGGKLKPPTKVHLCPAQDFVLRASGCQEVPEVLDSYSPMDISPCQVTLSESQLSRETSVTSEESFSHVNQYASADSQKNVMNDAIDEDLVAATQCLEINGEDVICGETEQFSSEHFPEKGMGVENHPGEFISASETESFKSANEELDFINDGVVTSVENEASSSTNIERQDSDLGTQFFSVVSSEDIGSSGFTFAASSTGQESSRRYHKKDSRAKVVHNSYSFSQNVKVPHASSPLLFSPLSADSFHRTPEEGKTLSESVPLHLFRGNSDVLGQESKQESDLTSATCVAAQEACEKWRLRGNQAYRNGDLSKAEECYTQGLNCVSRSETSRSCLRALMLCYSNRAATLMSLGRMRDALQDCWVAADIDPDFLKVQVRAANCHLAMGEMEHALQYFNKCLQFVCVDRKIAVEASEGLQKAQKVSEFMQHSSELLQRKTSDDAGKALEVIAEALSICPFSEKLLEMKAESLFMLGKYKDVIQLCEQTFDSAKNNTPSVHASPQLAVLDDSELRKHSSFRLWRCCLIVKSYFYLGKLEEAIGSLDKQKELDSLTKSLSTNGSKTLESSIPLAATVRELLWYKAAGNEAFQVGRYSEAIEHYTAALSRNVESWPFTAICFCNRAAAYKALGQITDAIADCSLAIALDGNYVKAISRRATLHEMIRDYGQAATDLQRMVAILTKQVEEKAKQPGTSDRSKNLANDLRQVRLRLSTIEEAFRTDIPLNMYLILGIEPYASAAEIKKAYRKAALRHHPDKAGQVLARSDNADEGLWKEIGEEVHKDADRLFKMIGEAYAVLSDPTKRSQYDLEDEMRNALKKRNGTSTYKTHMDVKNYPFERTGSRRQWREVGRSYGR